MKLLKREVEEGIRKRESLEGTIERKEECLEGLERYGKKMNELWKEEGKRGDEARKEKWEKISELHGLENKETELQDELRVLSVIPLIEKLGYGEMRIHALLNFLGENGLHFRTQWVRFTLRNV